MYVSHQGFYTLLQLAVGVYVTRVVMPQCEHTQCNTWTNLTAGD